MFRFLRRLVEFRTADLVGSDPASSGTVVGFGPASSAAIRTTRASQGPFELLFAERPDYLTLLNLPQEALPVIQFVAEVVRENPATRQSVLTLLADPDWRLHLVAAVAVLVSPDPAEFASALWQTVDKGSWVAPQLAAVLSLSDPQFISRAKARVLAGCPVIPSGVQFTSLEHHVIVEPGVYPGRSAKTLAAVLHLIHTIPSEVGWATAASSDPDLRLLLRSDRDLSDKIAAYWVVALKKHFGELGLPLPTAAS